MSIMLRLVAFGLLLLATVLFASVLRVDSTMSAQNANSSTTNKNQNQNQSAPRSIAPPAQAQEDFSTRTWDLPEDADKTKNPVPATPESIAKGKELYVERTKGNCVFCHGEKGSGNEANLPRLRRKPADLSNKERIAAMSDGEIFWKITKGIPGIMPAGENRMKEAEERWHLVNWVKTMPTDGQ
ncbi:MAG TPA: cytochrome c [Pyrinomonadaceae bacterium]|nr:cytochrome c [Pyrinomonadaceae bacterium]